MQEANEPEKSMKEPGNSHVKKFKGAETEAHYQSGSKHRTPRPTETLPEKGEVTHEGTIFFRRILIKGTSSHLGKRQIVAG